jgi:hypothetical protein
MRLKDHKGSNTEAPAAIPWLTALRVLELAHPHFHQKRGFGFGQLILKYQSGECKISRLDTVPPSANTFRVQILGSAVTVKDTRSVNF